jgi:hypothetical protein
MEKFTAKLTTTDRSYPDISQLLANSKYTTKKYFDFDIVEDKFFIKSLLKPNTWGVLLFIIN